MRERLADQGHAFPQKRFSATTSRVPSASAPLSRVERRFDQFLQLSVDLTTMQAVTVILESSFIASRELNPDASTSLGHVVSAPLSRVERRFDQFLQLSVDLTITPSIAVILERSFITFCELKKRVTSQGRAASAPRARVEKHYESCWILRSRTYEFNPIAEASQISDHLSGTLLLPLASHSRTSLLIDNALMQNLPD